MIHPFNLSRLYNDNADDLLWNIHESDSVEEAICLTEKRFLSEFPIEQPHKYI